MYVCMQQCVCLCTLSVGIFTVRLLRICCVNPHTDSVAAHIASKGGLEAVVAAMEACPTKFDVQQYGAWALANVAWSDPVIKQRAVDAGNVTT